MKPLVTLLCVALLAASESYGAEPTQHQVAEPTAEEIAAYKAALHAKLDEIEVRLQLHRQLLAQRALAEKLARTTVDD